MNMLSNTPKLRLTAILGLMALLLSPLNSRAQDGLATNSSGNWSSTITNEPWADGLVPTNTTVVEIEPPVVVTVDVTNAVCDYIFGSGELDMAPNSTLSVTDPTYSFGIATLATLKATATGNTVIYTANSFFCKHTDYYNLSLLGGGTLYTGNLGPTQPDVPITIYGNLVLEAASGHSNAVQLANSMTIEGNLLIGAGTEIDSSVAPITVYGNTTIDGELFDGAGSTLLDDVFSNITIDPGGTWNVSDVDEWEVTGNLTNNGTILAAGPTGQGGITFANTGIIIGNPFSIANLIVNGTTTFSTTVTATNFVGFGGTMEFDLGTAQHEVICGQPLTYMGNLVVVNSGATPTVGSSYQLFSAPSYSGSFASETLPSLPPGLAWLDNTLVNGSISVVSTAPAAPVITSSQFNPATQQFTLTWSSTPTVTYSVQYSSNLATDPFSSHVLATGIPSGGTSTTTTVALPPGRSGFLRVSRP